MAGPNTEIDRQLSRLATRIVPSGEMLEASRRIMSSSDGPLWSQAAAYHARALHAQGRIADGYAVLEKAWQRADRLDDPVAGAVAAYIGAGCSLMLYDYVQAEQWCTRELDRHRSRLVGDERYALTELLAAAYISQGNLTAARELLAEWEGAASRHALLAYHEGDWERAILLQRKEFDRTRAAGQLLLMANSGSVLGRIARICNRRVEAEGILDQALQAALAAADLNRELFIRIELALIDADFGQFLQAREELRRCKEILDNGEDWGGHQGAFAHTFAMVRAGEHILKYVSPDGRWHVALSRRSVVLPDEAVAGFRTAIEIFRRYHAPWEETAALIYWSQALFAASQVRQSFERYETAFAIFDRIATPQWNERIQTELFRFVTLDSLSEPITVGDGAGANLFRKEGDYWTMSFAGSMFRLRDTIGMHYISRLVANPGIGFTAQDLVSVAEKTIRKRGGGNGPASGSRGRAIGDRSKHQDGARERARLMVTKRIKDVITRIRLINPELARHFATSIRTGHTCTYVADEDHRNEWLT